MKYRTSKDVETNGMRGERKYNKGKGDKMVNYALIGRRIREVRKQQNLSQLELAEMSELSVSYISHIETAQKKASLTSIIKIADALGITVDELLYGNQLYNPTEYQTDIDILMADCSANEKRFIYELILSAKNMLRTNGWLITDMASSKKQDTH